MPLPESPDLERAINEFMEINWNLSMDEEQRVFEGRMLANVIADKLNNISPEERRRWIVMILAKLAQASHLGLQMGVQVQRMKIPSVN